MLENPYFHWLGAKSYEAAIEAETIAQEARDRELAAAYRGVLFEEGDDG
jgi:hypothetical protein